MMIEQHWIVNGTHYQKTLGKKTLIWKYSRIFNKKTKDQLKFKFYCNLYFFKWTTLRLISMLFIAVSNIITIFIFYCVYVILVPMSLIILFSYVCVEAWCAVMDSKKKEILPILERAYGAGNAIKWYVNWRLFFM